MLFMSIRLQLPALCKGQEPKELVLLELQLLLLWHPTAANPLVPPWTPISPGSISPGCPPQQATSKIELSGHLLWSQTDCFTLFCSTTSGNPFPRIQARGFSLKKQVQQVQLPKNLHPFCFCRSLQFLQGVGWGTVVITQRHWSHLNPLLLYSSHLLLHCIKPLPFPSFLARTEVTGYWSSSFVKH